MLRYAATTGRVLIRWDGAAGRRSGWCRRPGDDPRGAHGSLARRFLQVFGPTTVAAFVENWAGIRHARRSGAVRRSGRRSWSPSRPPIGDAWKPGGRRVLPFGARADPAMLSGCCRAATPTTPAPGSRSPAPSCPMPRTVACSGRRVSRPGAVLVARRDRRDVAPSRDTGHDRALAPPVVVPAHRDRGRGGEPSPCLASPRRSGFGGAPDDHWHHPG